MVQPLLEAYAAFQQILFWLPGPVYKLIMMSCALFIASRIVVLTWEVKG